jgi:hypothetical protein
MVDGSGLVRYYHLKQTEIEKTLFEGAVIYDPKTKLIYDVDLHFADSHKQFPRTVSFGLYVAVLDMRFKAVYKMTNNNYELSYNNRFVKYKMWTKNSRNIRIQE